MQPTHQIKIGDRWHDAHGRQFVNRRRGLPKWGYWVPALGRTVSGKEMERAEKEGRIRRFSEPLAEEVTA